VRIAPKIDDHDLATKARQAQRFLESGDKVKVAVVFRGREMLHQDIGRALLDKVVRQLQPVSSVDQDPRMEGRMMSVLLSPRKDTRTDAAKPAGGDEGAAEVAVSDSNGATEISPTS
jgi:translation initiation factor IF-3